MDEKPQGVMLAACRRLLRPIIRLLLRHGVMQRDFAELCKELYVDVATADYGLQGRPTNVSRTALLTGLDRKDIKRIREELVGRAEDVPHRGRQDRLARVLSGWHQDPDFMTGDGPRDLPLLADNGQQSFSSLVRRYGGDVPASALLKELKRAGAVVEADGRLRAVRRYYMPPPADADALRRAGSVLEDLGNTVVHNLNPPRKAAPRFEGRATNPLIAASAVSEFHAFLEQRGQQFLEEVDTWLTAHEAPAGEARAVTRLGVGVYWIQDGAK
jgi:hypothetical protein